MQQLLTEAFHSYQIYIQCSGVLDAHQAKLSLLLWPDIAHSAILLLDKPEDTSLRALLMQDLKTCVVEPIVVIHDSTMERVKSVTKKTPLRSETVATKVKKMKNLEPIEAKRLLLKSTNRMFTVLNLLTDVEFPVLNTKVNT